MRTKPITHIIQLHKTQDYFYQFALHLFFYKQSIFDPRPENCLIFSKKLPPKNCLVDGLLTSIAYLFKYSKRRHSLLQGHLEYVMRTFELTSPKVSISLTFCMQKKGFSRFSFNFRLLFAPANCLEIV